MPKIIIFTAISVWFVYVSRASLRVPRSHGFPRFLAWEAILALLLLNEPRWFEKAFSPRQLLSWLLLAISVFLVVDGLRLLRKVGNPSGQREDRELMDFEKTTRLVTVGTYRYIRHPMYCSLLCLAWGAFLKDVTVLSGMLVAAATLCLTVTARIDEEECLRFFGPSYREYMERTRRFVPFLL